jgi:hypothetical protein
MTLIQCKKRDQVFEYYFYTSIDTAQTTLKLYVDDKFIAELPFMYDVSDTATMSSLPSYTFKHGKYEVIAKDSNGNVRVKLNVKVNFSGFTAKTEKGKTEYHFFEIPQSGSNIQVEHIIEFYF